MKQTVWWTLAVLAMVGMIVLEAVSARSANELCPMGGVMVKTAIVKEKALDWAKDLPNVAVDEADTDVWTVLTLSRTDPGIAMLVGPGYVFFDVAQIEAGGVQKISDSVGLGLIEKEGRDWALKTSDCQAVDLPASGL